MSSSKEAEILQRQRLLAARLAQNNKSQHQPSSQSSSTYNKHQPTASSSSSATNTNNGQKPPVVQKIVGAPCPPAVVAAVTNPDAKRPHDALKRPSSSLASLTAKTTRTVASTTQTTTKKPPPPPPPRPPPPPHSALVSTKLKPTDNAKHASATTVSSTNSLKRASKKRGGGLVVLKNPSAAVAKNDDDDGGGSLTAAGTSSAAAAGDKDEQRPSPKLKRKTLATTTTTSSSVGGGLGTTSSGRNFSSLASLVPKVMSAANDDSYASTYPTMTPDNFWKHLREWDFVSHYYNSLNPPDDNSSSASATATTTASTFSKPLPNIFLNHRHYVAAWAPLCFAECRAQILQEWSANNSNVEPRLVLVESTHCRVKANKDTESWMMNDESMAVETGGHVILTLPRNQNDSNNNNSYYNSNTAAARSNNSSTNGRGGAWSFMNGDICLLIQTKYRNLIADMGRGYAVPPLPGRDIGDFSNISLIGHTESSRNDLNGLVLKVSKRRWAKIGQKEMCVLKLGSNVTALREFTALAKVETLPMKRYLLGQHLVVAADDKNNNTNKGNKNKKAAIAKLSRHNSTDSLLKKMGGTEALGEGFIRYAKDKFNASQLTAIAASANEYGEGGFTLIKGPPGTGKTTTLVAVLNSLHIRQYNKYYEEVKRIASAQTGTRHAALDLARRAKPRLLVTAPSNAAVDNIILKIMQDGFVDGSGQRYNPSMIRVGVGQGAAVRDVSLENKVDAIFAEHMDVGKLDVSIAGFKLELSRITQDIARLRRRCAGIQNSCPYPLGQGWEIRIDEETFDETSRVYFVNHNEHSTTFECPPPPEPGQTQFEAKSMPEYRSFMARIVKLVESYFNIKRELDRCTIVKSSTEAGANQFEVRQSLENHVLNSVHMVMTTLGTAGNRTLEGADKFEVVVVDEAAQSVEPAILSALQLGSRHAVLVGDPQQLPATIFNLSGRNSKYDRSLFQRLEEAGQPVYMLNEQYRMHPKISHFPRHIFYGGNLVDGPNVRNVEYGNPLRGVLCRAVPNFQPFMILDLDSKEERGGTSLSNMAEATLAVFLYLQLKEVSRGLSTKSKVAVITPYAQQSKLLRQVFADALGPRYADSVEVNTVDAFQGREANIVIFSAVRAAGSRGIGFLSDVRRMNVALTRAKHFLFVIARCESIVVNPYWSDLVQHARETSAVLSVPLTKLGMGTFDFGALNEWKLESSKPSDPRKRKRLI